MKWLNKYQSGETITFQPSIEDQVEQIVQGIIDNDERTLTFYQQLQTKAKQGDDQAKQLIQIIETRLSEIQSAKSGAKLDYIHTLRCGGKSKKVKKACGGRKMETGDKIPEAKCGKKVKKAEIGFEIKKISKGGCPCTQLKRVGGKLIEVDCNGGLLNPNQEQHLA